MISYLFLETGSYIFTKHDIDFQVISAFSIAYIIQQHIDFLFYFLILFFSTLLIISVKTKFLLQQFTSKVLFLSFFLLYLDLLIFYFVFLIAYKSFYPFSDIKFQEHFFLSLFAKTSAYSKLRKDYDDIFKTNKVRENQASLINVNNRKNKDNFNQFKKFDFRLNDTFQTKSSKPKRNLIIIQLESLEKQSLGIYNKFFHSMMPFMSNFSQKGVFIENAIPQPFTLWTSASIFSTHCGLPHVISDQIFEVSLFQSIAKWPNLPCFSKHFKNVGYNLYFSSGGPIGIMGIKSFFQQSGFLSEDAADTKIYHDYDFYFCMIERLFGKKIVNNTIYNETVVNKIKIKEPFLYVLNNDDTHPFFFLDDRCAMDQKKERVENCLNCLDFLLMNFFNAFEKSELFDRTDVLLYGDHPGSGRLTKVYKEPRNLLMFFPYLEKRKIEKHVTLYDIAPTLLDMMGIEYFPPFPYGANIFDDQVVGTFPVKDEFHFIYNHILGSSKNDLKCFQKDNCDDKWEYYRTRQYKLKRRRNDNYINSPNGSHMKLIF